jgi:hypothetical protein
MSHVGVPILVFLTFFAGVSRVSAMTFSVSATDC